MKKTMLAICAIAGLCVPFFSCKGKDSNGTNQSGKSESAKVQKTADSLIIYTGWDLYTEKDDGKMYAVREAECGDSVKIYLNDNDSIEQKIAIRHLSSGKEDSLNFVRVQYEGEDFWTRDIFLSGLGDGEDGRYNIPAVAIADTFAYSAPNGSAITGTQIAEGTVFAYRKHQPEGQDGFFNAVIYNGNPFGKEIWIKHEAFVTDYQPLFEIVRTLSKIDEKTKPEVREEIILEMIDSAQKGFMDFSNSGLFEGSEQYFEDKINAFLAKYYGDSDEHAEEFVMKVSDLLNNPNGRVRISE